MLEKLDPTTSWRLKLTAKSQKVSTPVTPVVKDGRSKQVKPQRKCVLVLGMHRSGTSAVARVAILLGCKPPSTLMLADVGNDEGHWESNAIVPLNEQILASAGSCWNDWLELNADWRQSPTQFEFLTRAREVLQAEYGRAPLFVLKDPRICRLADFWLEVLAEENVDVAVIAPIRHPLEVARSLAHRDASDEGLGMLLWLRHVLEAEVATRSIPRHYFLYSSLLEDPDTVIARIESGCQLKWPRKSVLTSAEIGEFLKDQHRHQRTEGNGREQARMPEWVRLTFDIFQRWSKTGEDIADHATLDSIRADFNAAAPTFARMILSGTGAGPGFGSGATQIDEETAAVAEVQAQLEDALAAREAGLQRLNQLEAEHRQAVSILESELATAMGALEASKAEGHDFANQLRQRQDEVQQAWSELAVERNARELVAGELEKSETTRVAVQVQLDDALAARDAGLQQLSQLEAEHRQAASKVEAELATVIGALEASRAEGYDVANQLRQRQEEAQQTWSELAVERNARELVAGELEKSEAERAALRANLNDYIAKLLEEANLRASLEAKLALAEQLAQDRQSFIETQNAKIDELGAALEAARSDHDAAQSALAQAAVEAERLANLLAEAERTEKAMNERLTAAENAHSEERDRLVHSVRSAEADRDALTARLDKSAKDLAVVTDLLAVAERNKDALNARLATAENLHSEERDRLVRSVRSAESDRATVAARLDKSAKDLAVVTDLLADAEQSQRALSEQLATTRGEQQAQAAKIDMAERQREEAIAQISRQNHEIAQLSVLAGQEANAAATLRHQADWLREVTQVQSKLPAWWRLLPKRQRDRKLAERLTSLGLFDSKIYLLRYPDVAASGIDPFVHYLRHGIFEARTWQ